MRKAMPMRKHFRVRSVLLSQGASALTLSPVDWWKPHPTETEKVGGEDIPKMVDADPSDPEAEPWEEGGKMTEIRMGDETEFKPGDLVTVEVTATR